MTKYDSVLEIRDELIRIRLLLDELPTKGKQKFTQLIKDLE